MSALDDLIKQSDKPSWSAYLRDYLSKSGGTIQEAAKSFFPAMARGAVLRESESPLKGSVIEPPLERAARKTGEFTGKTLAMGASMIPGAKVAQVASRAGAIPIAAQALGGSASLGAYKGAEAVSGGLEAKLPGKEIAKQATIESAKGGLAGLGFGATVGYLSSKLATWLGHGVPSWLYNRVARITKAEALKDIKHGHFELLGDDLANLPGFTGSKQTLANKATQNIDRLEDSLDSVLAPYLAQEKAAKFSSIDTEKVLEPLKTLSEKYGKMKGAGWGDKKKEVDALIHVFRKEQGRAMGIKQAHDLKKYIWSEVKDPQWRKTVDQNPVFARAQILLGSGLRREVANAVPESALILAEEGIYMGARQALQERLASEGGRSILGPLAESLETRVGRGLRYGLKQKTLPRKIISGIAKPAIGVGVAENLP